MFVALLHLLLFDQQKELLLRQGAAETSCESSLEFYPSHLGYCSATVLGILEAFFFRLPMKIIFNQCSS